MKLKYRKKSTKTGKNFRGGGGKFFWLARIYTPGIHLSFFPVCVCVCVCVCVYVCVLICE